jgi:hypothetical protein
MSIKSEPFTLLELRPIKRLHSKINIKNLRDSLNKSGYWEWISFKNPVCADRLGIWAWRGGALGYTERKPSK